MKGRMLESSGTTLTTTSTYLVNTISLCLDTTTTHPNTHRSSHATLHPPRLLQRVLSRLPARGR
jgi:hypothetical protein